MQSIIQANALPTPVKTGAQQTLGKDAFLKLMLTQMQNQDPLAPLDNQAMVAQLAQFSSLEQMTNLNSNFTNANVMSSFVSATNLLGKDVSIINPTSSADAPTTITSRVQAVSYTSQGPQLTLANGQTTTVQQLVNVSVPTGSQ